MQHLNEKALAAAILAHPREHYAAKDGAEPQTALFLRA